jgi:hypothetical protein
MPSLSKKCAGKSSRRVATPKFTLNEKMAVNRQYVRQIGNKFGELAENRAQRLLEEDPKRSRLSRVKFLIKLFETIDKESRVKARKFADSICCTS